MISRELCSFVTVEPGVQRCHRCRREVRADCDPTRLRAVCQAAQQLVPACPGWEVEQRLAVCAGCRRYHNQRCTLIDLGCRTTFGQYVTRSDRTCPEDLWPAPYVRWVRVAELVEAAGRMADLLPADITSVVAVPRSGMLPASVIACQRHLPLYAVRGGVIVPVGGGSRMRGYQQRRGRAVLVDDTVASGRTLSELRAAGVRVDRMHVAAPYVMPEAVHLVSTYWQALPKPHLLEWNFANSLYAQHVAMDLDGIICRNPPESHVPHPPERGQIYFFFSCGGRFGFCCCQSASWAPVFRSAPRFVRPWMTSTKRNNRSDPDPLL
jgi:hypothetical protein